MHHETRIFRQLHPEHQAEASRLEDGHILAYPDDSEAEKSRLQGTLHPRAVLAQENGEVENKLDVQEHRPYLDANPCKGHRRHE